MGKAAWAEHARAELASAGLRAGGARGEVVDLLSDQHCCLTAQEIFDRLRDAGRPVGLASVYRAVETLASLHLVHRVDVDGTAAYEPADPSGEHHHHAICDGCGDRAIFADSELEARIDAVARRLGYRIEGHELSLRGRCAACASD